MSSVAEGFVVRVLALAEVGRLGLFRLEHERDHAMFFMRTVAERLFVGMTAGAPGVALSGFELDCGGLLGGDMGFGHGVS